MLNYTTAVAAAHAAARGARSENDDGIKTGLASHLPAVKSCDKNLPRFTIAPVTYSRLHVRMLLSEILFLLVRKGS